MFFLFFKLKLLKYRKFGYVVIFFLHNIFNYAFKNNNINNINLSLIHTIKMNCLNTNYKDVTKSVLIRLR